MEYTYWRSLDNEHFCVDIPCTTDSLPVIGYFRGIEDLVDLKRIASIQENALDFDKYSHGIELDLLGLSHEEKKVYLNGKKDEKPGFKLNDIYRGVEILSVQEFTRKAQEIEGGRVLSRCYFVPVSTPDQFSYTVFYYLLYHGDPRNNGILISRASSC